MTRPLVTTDETGAEIDEAERELASLQAAGGAYSDHPAIVERVRALHERLAQLRGETWEQRVKRRADAADAADGKTDKRARAEARDARRKRRGRKRGGGSGR